MKGTLRLAALVVVLLFVSACSSPAVISGKIVYPGSQDGGKGVVAYKWLTPTWAPDGNTDQRVHLLVEVPGQTESAEVLIDVVTAVENFDEIEVGDEIQIVVEELPEEILEEFPEIQEVLEESGLFENALP